jgi:mono/diheme cytochrome c family protein
MRKSIGASFLCFLAVPAFAQPAAPNADAGKALWEGNKIFCQRCHGKNGEGGFGPDLAGRGLSSSEFRQAVRKPWGIMPAFNDEQLTDADIDNLAAYFATLPKNPEPGPWRFPTQASFPVGQQVFHDVGCAQCHEPTFDMPRAYLGGLDADFGLFKDIVYNHTDTMPKVWKMLGSPQLAVPQPPDGKRPMRMGNYTPTRVAESQLREIYVWARNDIGFSPDLQARFSEPAPGSSGATYTISIANNGLKGKGFTAQGLTVDLAVPAGAAVVNASGSGYKGTRMDGGAATAEWKVARLPPKERQSFAITLSKVVGTGPEGLKGTVRWDKPGPRNGPNKDMLDISPPLRVN